MKKVVLLVAVFLVGITTQAFSTNQLNVEQDPGKKHRYYKSQSIDFVENGVRYTVFTNGTFDFTIINKAHLYNRGRQNQNVVQYVSAPGAVRYTKVKRRPYRAIVRTNRYGNIVGIGSTLITYKRNGKVKDIGIVPLYYYRGQLTQIGNMAIVYNRHGYIKSTVGKVNRFNRKTWHDDWYINNSCDSNDYWEDNFQLDQAPRKERKRKKKLKNI